MLLENVNLPHSNAAATLLFQPFIRMSFAFKFPVSRTSYRLNDSLFQHPKFDAFATMQNSPKMHFTTQKSTIECALKRDTFHQSEHLLMR